MPVKTLEIGALVKFSRWPRTWPVDTRESNGVSRNTKYKEGLCVIVVHGDKVNDQYSGFHELDTYGSND